MMNEAAWEASPSRKVSVHLNGQSQKEVNRNTSNTRLVEANRRLLEAKKRLKNPSLSQRKVFSTGYFAKKLKRFQKDSPSAPNRRVSQGISVVDLCSSDEEDDGSDKIGKVPKEPKSLKDPSQENENNGFKNKAPTNNVLTMVGTDVGTNRSENPKRKASPQVNLCSSSSSDDDDDDDDESFKTSDHSSKKFGREGTSMADRKFAKEVLEKSYTKLTGKTYQKPQSHAMPKPMASWKIFSQDLAKRKSEILDLKNIVSAAKRTAAAATTGMETTFGASLFAFPSVSSHSFSTDRKRKLLTLLVPKSLSPETIKAENWETADYLSVSKGFAERFGNLDTKDLERLARGESLVPEGMVSTEFTSKEKALLPEHAAKLFHTKITTKVTAAEKYIKSFEEKDGIEKASAPIIDANTSTDKASSSAGESQSETNSTFGWNGTFKLVAKDRPDEFDTNSAPIGSRNKNNVVRNDFIDSKSTGPTKKLQTDGIERDFDGKRDHNHPFLSCNESQPTENYAGSIDSGAQDDSKGGGDEVEDQKETYLSVGKIEKDDIATKEPKAKVHDDCEDGAEKTADKIEADVSFRKNEKGDDTEEIKSQAQDGLKCHIEKTENPKEADISVGKDEQVNGAEETKPKAQDINEDGAGETDSPEKADKTVAKDEREGDIKTNPEAQDDNDFDAGEIEDSKEVDETIENTVIQYKCEEDPAEDSQGPVAEIMEEDKQERDERPMIVISAKQLVLLALPLLCVAGIFRRLGLFDVSNSILEGCFRTLLQLHILGSLLSPIFKYGAKYPVLVGCYALFMIVLASYEASTRTKYTHENHFTIIVQSLLLNVSWVAMWAFGAILKPRPVWNPRYLLPIVGMLLGNSINGVSITLNTITTSLVEKQAEVDLYLSFGADQYEAVSGIIAHAIQKGTTPSLNMMCVVGIVSIPGMMTGQILGGSSPMVAARYQAMIIFLIVLSTLSTIMCSSCLTVMSAFSSHQILRPDRFVKNHKRGLARLILWVWGYVFGSEGDLVTIGSNRMPDGSGGGLFPGEELNINLHSSVTGFDIRPLRKGLVVSDGERKNALIQGSGLNRYFEARSNIESDTHRRRVLFEDLSFGVNEGDLLLVSGPSGSGKSQLLRMVAGLSPLQDGEMRLQGRSWEDHNGNDAVKWRKQIRYVTQTKVQVPGTPLQFIKKILSFRSWKAVDDRNDLVIEHDFMKHVSHHIRQWGMGIESLNKEWSVLSGGESQRVLMAIALASRPKILLFDESTSALDHKSKLAVETSIKDFVADHEGGVLWVSHDEQQVERLMDHLESDGVNID